MDTFLRETLEVNFTETNTDLYFETADRVSSTSQEFFLGAVEKFFAIFLDNDDRVIVDMFNSSTIRVSSVEGRSVSVAT